jgi:hypothetical protein
MDRETRSGAQTRNQLESGADSVAGSSTIVWRRTKINACSSDDPAAHRHRTKPLKLLSWNVNGRTGEHQLGQLAAVLARAGRRRSA